MENSEKTALVIGGTSSIGGEITTLLSSQGMKVCAVGRSAGVTESLGEKVSFFSADFEKDGLTVLENNDFASLLLKTDILCVCYGPFVQKPLHETSADDWKNMALLDYALPGSLVSLVLPRMMENKFGRILLFGGTGTEGIRASMTNAAYAGAKTGISVLVKSTAKKYAPYNITCNAILPGFTRNAPPDAKTILPSEIAKCALNLLSDENLNGVLLNVDAGWIR